MENKKFWYIQLNVNFFEDERIDWLCEQENGYTYVVLYLKLCLKTANNNGILTRQVGDMIIPYNISKIAEITKINVDIVRVALELYKKIGLIYEADENNNFMRLPEVPAMVGYTTQYAISKANQREKKKLALLVDNVSDNVLDNVSQELRVKSKELRVKSIDIEKDIYISKYGDYLKKSIEDWLSYKKERREAYKPTGLKSLYTQIDKQAKIYGEKAVADLITLSMSNGWRGIIWDKLKEKDKGSGNPFLDMLEGDNDIYNQF